VGIGRRTLEDVVMFGEAYRGRRVLVTGHTGFKGSWLSYWLTQLGAEVTGYALEPPTEPSLFDALGLDQLVSHVVADIRDAECLERELVKAAPDVVLHLAAQPIVRESYARPVETFATNVMGTVNVLQAARACAAVQAVVVVTTDKCYRNTEDGRPFVEDDPLGGRDPYSASKGCAELVTAAYAASFFAERDVAVASARAGNVIGGGDWAADRIVPDCVRALEAGRAIDVRNPSAVRPWQHVLEPLAGYLQLATRMLDGGGAFAGAWNFGPAPEDALTVQWVVDRFLEEWGRGSWETAQAATPQPHEAHLLTLDSSKAVARLGWAPRWDAGEAVRRTAAWYHGRADDAATARVLCEADIRAYENAAAGTGSRSEGAGE
jgi:CDP-glucose 4,6-dehydratase